MKRTSDQQQLTTLTVKVLAEKIAEKIDQNPKKAATILTLWIKQKARKDSMKKAG